MENLHWQLSVLTKAIHYKNLSGAAAHIGLSQPQLSRIISRLESELNVVLLDRAVRRKSGWTPIAYKIAESYSRNARKLQQSLAQLCSDDQLSQLHIGTLEGLAPIASAFCKQLFEQTKVQLIELDVLDLSELEEHFERDELDLVFTSREPGRQKYKYMRGIGYQTFDKVESDPSLRVFSPFEYASQVSRQKSASKSNQKADPKSVKANRIFLSNSLVVRRQWVEEYGGSSLFPSEVRRKKTGHESEVPVYLIGSEMLSPAIWQKIESFKL